jgi:hypothetical protein
MAVAYQAGGLPTKDGGAYFLRPEGNPSGLTTSLESRAQSVTNVFANVYHTHPFNNGLSADTPAKNISVVTPSNNDLTYIPTAIYVGSSGNMTVVMRDGTSGTITNIPNGTTLKISPLKITSATASGIMAWW